MGKDERSSAIVVTFHPRPEYLQNLAKIRTQVDVLVVVDNGSSSEQLQIGRAHV